MKDRTPSSTPKNRPTAPVGLEAPLDLAEVRADETLVESLRHADPAQNLGSPVGKDELARLVLEWRREIDAVPFSGEPSLVVAASALQSGKARRPRRLLTPVAAAAAAVGIALSSVALLAHDSQPGDPLWGVTQVVFADHARSVVATTEAESSLQQARTALVAGSPQSARAALEQASVALRSVQDGARRSDLVTLYTALIAELAQKAPSAPIITSTAVSPTTTVMPPVLTSTAPSIPPKVQPPPERTTVVLPPPLPPPPLPAKTESPVPTTEAPPSPEPPTSTEPTPSLPTPSPSTSETTTESAPTTAATEPSSDVQSPLPNGLATGVAPNSVLGD